MRDRIIGAFVRSQIHKPDLGLDVINTAVTQATVLGDYFASRISRLAETLSFLFVDEGSGRGLPTCSCSMAVIAPRYK